MSDSFDLHRRRQVLAATPAVLRAMLAGLDQAWTHTNYGEGTFSPFDVLGHLIHGERTDWIPRARIILEHGESRPFDPYDRYAQFEESRGKSLAALLDTFETLRRENLQTLDTLAPTPEQLARRGRHPAFGPVTLDQLLATWVAHDLNHIAQIAKAMATQLQNAIGPWREYLTILKHPPVRMER